MVHYRRMAGAERFFIPKQDRPLLAAVLALVALAVYAAFDPRALLVVALGSLFLVLVAARGYRYGLVLLVALSPFLGLRFQLPPFREGILARFFSDGVDLALANAVGLLLILVFVSDQLLRRLLGQRKIHLRLPGAWYAAAFIMAALLSAQNADDPLLSIKYAFFPVAFSIVGFAYLPVNLIKTRRMLVQTLRVFFSTGVAAAAMGILSLFLVPSAGLLKRATVLGLGGVFPLGTNHNLLAEALLAVAPLGLALSAISRRERAAYWYRVGSVLMVGIAVLTFARTAWIVLALQIGLWLWLSYRHKLRALIKPAAVALLLALPLVAYMAVFSRSPAVTGSTEARLSLTRFSLFLFLEHPLVGAGAGTFVERLGGSLDFTQDFGDPLDAHGFVQKTMAETGTLGLASFVLFLGWILRALYRSWNSVPLSARGEKRLMLALLVSAAGVISYQLFNTSYYNAKMWLPIGLALAARELTRRKT